MMSGGGSQYGPNNPSGQTTGAGVGLVVGECVGLNDGECDGLKVSVGDIDLETESVVVGDSDGKAVGDSIEGVIDGRVDNISASLGFADGLAEGFVVGTCVFVGALDCEPLEGFVGKRDRLE